MNKNNIFWGYYCKDNGNGRHLTITTNKQLYINAYRNEKTVQFLKDSFQEFMRKFDKNYQVSNDFSIEPVNVYHP